MWFDIIAATMGFVGSIIFSAGLIKSKQQILDENTSYFDENPFTLKAELRSQPYYVVGIGFIITGFAMSIAGSIAENLHYYQVLVSILIAVSISMLGFFGMAVFYILQSKSHQRNYVSYRKKIFYSSLRTYSSAMHGIDGKENEKELFASAKDTYQKDLLKKAESIPEPDNETEMNVVRDIDATSAPYQFYAVTKSFLE
ncbi:MAG: hypothetical protein WBO49_00925 [Candidatus Saccharimonas sp.]